MTQENTRAAAKASIIEAVFTDCSEAVFAAMAPLFAQRSTRMSARDYLTGLLAELPRKNCWTLAEHVGHSSPDRLQYLLERAVWDERELRGIVAAAAVAALGAGGVLIFDETGDLKKGTRSLGAARQYTGTAGRVENAQVTTWAVWATETGHALIDYEVYLHGEWFAEDDTRLGEAHAPGPVPKRTKGQQAAEMLQPQSALAYKEVVPVPVIEQPLADAKVENATQHVSGSASGAVDKVEIYDELKLIGTAPVSNGKWTYTPSTDWSEGKHELAVLAVHGTAKSGRTYRNFYLVKPTASVQIITPKNGEHVDDSAHIEGHAFNAGTVELKDGGNALGTVPVTSNKWAYAHAEAWALGEHTVHATAVSGGIRSTEAQTTFTVEKRNLNVTYQFSGSWSDSSSGVEEHVYSYNIVLTADTKSVERWRLGFKQLPAKAHLAGMFTKSFWGVVIKDGTDGTVLLGSPPPEEGKHIIFAGKELHVQVQVAFPDKNSAHEKLYGLFAEDWSGTA